jgi:hypothetical protein
MPNHAGEVALDRIRQLRPTTPDERNGGIATLIPLPLD